MKAKNHQKRSSRKEVINFNPAAGINPRTMKRQNYILN